MNSTEGRPAWWTDRAPGEPAMSWVLRLQLLYRLTRLIAALDAA